jgi:putative tryptophan/tyrosine transport system substrate-binding protein
MAGSSNPVERGLVSSLAHPGGNVTGVTSNPGPALGGKALQLFKEADPSISRLAILWDSGGDFLDVQRAVAGELKLALLPHDVKGVTSGSDFDVILSSVIQEHADSLFAFANLVNLKYEKKITDFVSNNRLPSMFQAPRYVNAGGLMSYSTNWLELRRRAAVYVDKIFKGAKPADLPVEQPSRFDLVVNLKTAEALGLTIPQSVLALADKVIE